MHFTLMNERAFRRKQILDRVLDGKNMFRARESLMRSIIVASVVDFPCPYWSYNKEETLFALGKYVKH